jgi:hypothetical protein
MTHVFRHPKFYRIPRDKEEARAQLKVPSSVIRIRSLAKEPATAGYQRAPGPGHKQQAPSSKLQAPSVKLRESQASSDKRQALRCKRQA